MPDTGRVDRTELRHWVEDALSRHDRDAQERSESVENVTVPEIVDAVWGRLPLQVRRATSRGQVQASLTMITLRRGIAASRTDPDDQAAGPAAVTGTPQS
jgi:hypothetical protein